MKPFSDAERARRVARRLLNLYPRPWRARYQREMRALLDEMPVGWGQVTNLAGTCVREWLSPRAFGWPARAASGRILTRRNLTFVAFAYLLNGLSRIVAALLLDRGVTATDDLQDDLAYWIMFPILGRIVLAFSCRTIARYPLLAGAIARLPWLARLSDWEVVLWLFMIQPGAIVNHMLPTPSYLTDTMAALKPYMDVYYVAMWCMLLLGNSGKSVRIRRIYLASFKRIYRPRTAA